MAQLASIPRFARDLLNSCPRASCGVHNWLFRIARVLHHFYPNKAELADLIASASADCGREVPLEEIEQAIASSEHCAWKPGEKNTQIAASAGPRWPLPNEEQIEAITSAADAPGLVDLWEVSPIRFDDEPCAEGIIDALFPSNPLLCCGRRIDDDFGTGPREDWRGQLARQQFIVPSPMSAVKGRTKDGNKLSLRTLDNTGPRRFLVIEFDQGSYDTHAAVLWHLAHMAPLPVRADAGRTKTSAKGRRMASAATHLLFQPGEPAMKTQWVEKAAIPDVKPPPVPAQKNGNSEEKPPPPPPVLLDFYSIPLPPADDPNELLKHRFLCRGGGMLVVGNTGIGKSALVIQCAILWSIGREAFGIKPRGALRILILQAENDEGDMAEFREGILVGIGVTDEERAQSVIFTACVDSPTGEDFWKYALEPSLETAKPDIVIIDPALAYLGGEANQQRDVSKFLRNGLNPLLHKYKCGLVLVHHTSKPPQGEQKAAWAANEFAYLGTSSVEWANWARAALVIRSLGSHDYFELRAAKRGKRLHWTAEDFETPVFTKIIAHSTTGICWREASKEEFEASTYDDTQTRAGRYKPPLEQLLSIFPSCLNGDTRAALLSADQIKNAFHDRGWHKDFYKGLCDEAEASGKIKATRAGRYNQVLRGLPALIEAHEKREVEKATIMEEVPLSKHVRRNGITRRKVSHD